MLSASLKCAHGMRDRQYPPPVLTGCRKMCCLFPVCVHPMSDNTLSPAHLFFLHTDNNQSTGFSGQPHIFSLLSEENSCQFQLQCRFSAHHQSHILPSQLPDLPVLYPFFPFQDNLSGKFLSTLPLRHAALSDLKGQLSCGRSELPLTVSVKQKKYCNLLFLINLYFPCSA